MYYYTSLILQSNQNTPSLEVISNWFKRPILNQPDITLINQEGESIKIETIREVKEKLSYASYLANQVRYFIFLDAHLLTIPAQNALLKSIEEPPADTQLIFVTHFPEKLLETIRSRCEVQVVASATLSEDAATKTVQNAEFAATSKLFSEIVSASYGQKIALAATYKERSEALAVCTRLLHFLHKELQTPTAAINPKNTTHNLQVILQTIEYLEHNTNALLTIENCFFELQ